MFRAGSYCLELLNPSAPYSVNRARSFSFSVDTKEDFYDQLLKCCNGLVFLKQIHSALATAGLITQRPHLGSQIIIKYAKYGDSHGARSLFDGVHGDETDSFLWNSMIRAYTNDGQYIETLKLYYLLRRSGISPNNYTFPFVLKACALKSVILEGSVVHGDAIRTGFDSDRYVEAALADMYAKCGQIANARKVFDKMAKRDLVCWTTMITAYEQAMQPLESLLLFQKMQEERVFSDAVAVVSITSAVGQLGDARKALVVHAYAITNGFLEDSCVGNSIIAMYGKCGVVEKARLVFDSMEVRDGISWNSLLSVYTQNGRASEALLLFDLMQDSEYKPNSVTLLIMVSACAYLGCCHYGRKLHNYIIDNKIKIDESLSNALMDMYAKSGDLEKAVAMFKIIRPIQRNADSWNVLISGYGVHGRGKESLEVFSQMLREGVEPDHISFTSVLAACSHAGLIDEGRKCFADMKKSSVKPEVKHYASMVDMLGRAGLLHEAYDLIKKMPFPPNDAVWGALLLACRIHGNTELGEIAAANLFRLEPEHSGYYVLMSNIYAASNKWQEVVRLRENMKSRGLKKPAAFSVVEYGKEVHGFHTADQENPYWREVHRKVENLAVEMKMAGYVPDRSCVLHDVEDEEKEHILNYHNEKLAVAFGIMKIDRGLAIQVTKNLRICNDCHSAFKFISQIYGRKIIVRDGNRFHHFEDGTCSCKDYW